MNITDAYIAGLRLFSTQKLTEDILHQIKRCVLDYIGVTYAGAADIRGKIEPFLSIGTEDSCTVFGFNKKMDIHSAAIANGFSSHVIELDDGHRFGMLHLEATIMTAMIAVAQKERLTFAQFLKGILVGYEATVRLATAIQPGHKQMGFHATGTCGAIGVACGVGFAIGLSDEQIKGAVSAAATSASGLLEVIDDGSQLKPYNVANAVESGINAAYIGRSGFGGPDDVIGGKRGFLNAFSSIVVEEKIFNNSGEPAINQIYIKPYAACRHCHAPIECVLNLRSQKHFDPTKIKSIEVQTYKLAILGHDQVDVTNASTAKMSIPYSVAAAILLGSCGIEAFCSNIILREDIQNLLSKVKVVENEKLTAASPKKRGAIVSITLNDGTDISDQVEYPLGEPENNVSDTQLEEKYDSLMTYAGINREKRQRIKKFIWNLEDYYEAFIDM